VRAFNRVLSAFLAAILIVAGVLAILEICRAALSQPPAVVQWPKLLPKLRNNSYDDAGPILVCVGLAVLGLLISVSGLKRGKPYALPAGSTAPGVRTEIHRRSLQRAIRAAVMATDRVDSGSVLLRRRSALIVARANTQSIDGLEAEIRQRVERLLASIALVDPPRLKIKVHAASAPPAPKPPQTPVGVAAAPERQAAAVGAVSTDTISAPAPQVRPPVTTEPPSQADRSPETAWSPKPEPVMPASQAPPETKPVPEPKFEPKPKFAPEPEPEPEPPTTHLDDLLSGDPEDESR
jgi:hypothetical protein